MIYKNVTGQKLAVFAYTASSGAAKTGDAAQITAYLSKDFGTAAATNDTNPTELDATNMPGWYVFDLTQAETNAEVMVLAAKSSTSGVVIDQVQVLTQDAAISSRSSHSAADVWAVGTRTLTSFGALVSDIWAAATRTLTAASDSSGVTTLLSRIIGTLAAGTHNPQSGDAYARLGAPAGASVSADIAAVKAETAAILDDTDDIGVAGAGLTAVPWNAAWDAEVQSEATDALNAYDPPTKAELDAAAALLATAANLATLTGYVDTEVAAILAAVDTEVAAIKAKTDNLPASPAATSDIPTANENADALLKRDMSAVTGEAARSVLNALRSLRNKVAIFGSTMTVYKEDDTTSAWTAAVTGTTGADPITAVDPA